MRKAIAALEKVGHIRQIHDGRWLFKAVLAPKPHQEHVENIGDFVWQFCVNYVPLNSVTRIIAYPIPRCDSAVFNKFGNGQWLWLFDAPSGHHQLTVAESSQEKLAFQGPDAIKWTYTVMSFGPTNGPAMFINFIHDVDSQWKTLATSSGISIDEQTNTCIIVDNIVSHGLDLSTSLKYMECQLRVCQAYCLSLSLKKSFIFPKRFKFVGNDVSPREIALRSPNISFSLLGLSRSWYVILPSSLVSCNSTANSFITSSCGLLRSGSLLPTMNM
jgi:hypothetical protein